MIDNNVKVFTSEAPRGFQMGLSHKPAKIQRRVRCPWIQQLISQMC